MEKENKYSEIAVRNIKTISNIGGIPIGNLEKEIGVATGYFSRVNRVTCAPSFEVIVRASKYLCVAVDDLIKDDLLDEIKGYEDKINDCMSKIKERFPV